MPIQTYQIYTNNAFAGQIAYASEPRTVVSGVCEDTELNYGVALKPGTGDRGVTVGHSTGNVMGISVRELNHEAKYRPSDGTTTYKETETVSVMRQGTINVLLTTNASTKFTKLYVNDTDGTFAGQAAVGFTQCTNVVALETGVAGDIIKARIDILA